MYNKNTESEPSSRGYCGRLLERTYNHVKRRSYQHSWMKSKLIIFAIKETGYIREGRSIGGYLNCKLQQQLLGHLKWSTAVDSWRIASWRARNRSWSDWEASVCRPAVERWMDWKPGTDPDSLPALRKDSYQLKEKFEIVKDTVVSSLLEVCNFKSPAIWKSNNNPWCIITVKQKIEIAVCRKRYSKTISSSLILKTSLLRH